MLKKRQLPLIIRYGLGIFLLVSGQAGFAQNTKTTRVSESLSEVYTYAQNDKRLKDGLSKVLDEKSNVLAMGYYRQNKKAGVWNYYNQQGIVVQQYDHTNRTLLSNKNHDEQSIVQFGFEILDQNIPSGVDVEPPVKVGGINYGFYLLYNTRQIPKELRNETATLNAALSYEFTIGANGKLEKWDIVYLDEATDKPIRKENQQIRHLPEDAYEFIAAKVDGKPVKSKIIYVIPLRIKENSSQRVGDSHNIISNE